MSTTLWTLKEQQTRESIKPLTYCLFLPPWAKPKKFASSNFKKFHSTHFVKNFAWRLGPALHTVSTFIKPLMCKMCNLNHSLESSGMSLRICWTRFKAVQNILVNGCSRFVALPEASQWAKWKDARLVNLILAISSVPWVYIAHGRQQEISL